MFHRFVLMLDMSSVVDYRVLNASNLNILQFEYLTINDNYNLPVASNSFRRIHCVIRPSDEIDINTSILSISDERSC